jgi:hypothetical protein
MPQKFVNLHLRRFSFYGLPNEIYVQIEETEPIFVHVYGAQESIPPAYVAWRSGTTKEIGLSYRPVRLGIDSWAP